MGHCHFCKLRSSPWSNRIPHPWVLPSVRPMHIAALREESWRAMSFPELGVFGVIRWICGSYGVPVWFLRKRRVMTCLITVHCGTSFESHECFGGKHLISAKSQIHRRADLLFELRKGGRCGWLQYWTQSDSAPFAQDLFPLQKWWLAKLTTSWRQNPLLGPRSEMGSYALLLSWKSAGSILVGKCC